MKLIKTQLDQLEYNIDIWKRIISIQDKFINSETEGFPFAWSEYVNAQSQLKRIKNKYGTIEVYEIKDLFR
mgnify:CR=1 FL=1